MLQIVTMPKFKSLKKSSCPLPAECTTCGINCDVGQCVFDVTANKYSRKRDGLMCMQCVKVLVGGVL